MATRRAVRFLASQGLRKSRQGVQWIEMSAPGVPGSALVSTVAAAAPPLLAPVLLLSPLLSLACSPSSLPSAALDIASANAATQATACTRDTTTRNRNRTEHISQRYVHIFYDMLRFRPHRPRPIRSQWRQPRRPTHGLLQTVENIFTIVELLTICIHNSKNIMNKTV